jgi:CheY-like chemotaxis protein
MNLPAESAAQKPLESTILVADDDVEFRQAMAEIIALEGWQVWEAADGEEALVCACEQNPDVLVLDHRMPRLTGLEVIQRLREDGNRVPVVLVSAAYEVRDLAMSVGVHCHLRKPFGVDELVTLLKRALQGKC